MNNQSTVDKAAFAKGVSSPQVAGSNVITPRNRSSFTRLLDYVSTIYHSGAPRLLTVICIKSTIKYIFEIVEMVSLQILEYE